MSSSCPARYDFAVADTSPGAAASKKTLRLSPLAASSVHSDWCRCPLDPGRLALHFAMKVACRPRRDASCFICVLKSAALSAMRRASS